MNRLVLAVAISVIITYFPQWLNIGITSVIIYKHPEFRTLEETYNLDAQNIFSQIKDTLEYWYHLYTQRRETNTQKKWFQY